MKICRACKRPKRLTAFWRRAESPDGRDPWCTDCRRSYFRRWSSANRGAYNRQQRLYYRENLEHLREYNRDYQRRRRALMKAGKWNTQAKRVR
jgi:hypothetical protein